MTHVDRILHNVVTFFLTKYYTSDKIKEGVMGEKCDTYGGMRKAWKVSVGKPEENRPLESLSHMKE